MMDYWDVACIVLACTAANHLGPIPDVERVIRRKLPVIGCVKCLTFWSVLAYGVAAEGLCDLTLHSSITLLATSFLSSWSTVWLDLLMGTTDNLYQKIYDTFYPAADEADADALGAADAVPGVPGKEECQV